MGLDLYWRKKMIQNTITLKDNRTLAYKEYGDKNGKPVFLFHGLHSSRLEGSIVANEAKKHNIHLIVQDRAGIYT